jgi:DNA-binding response OmpR family regulator
VLVLSANAASIERVADYLTAQGFEVDSLLVDAKADLRTRLLKSRPGALVLDLNLASERGWEILRLLKSSQATHDAPVLFYSLSMENGTGSLLEMDTLTKPVSMNDLAQALARQGLLTGGEEKTILIVDDDASIREMNARIVQAQSSTHRVLKARDGREALEMMRHRPVDLVLLDLMMPELDGFGVLEAMREAEATRDIPVIVLTSKLLTEVDMLRLNRGVATVLEKGMFSVEETLVHIEEVLALNHKLGSEAQRLVRKGMAYLHEHYSESITRDMIARYVGVSDDYLTRCFQQELRMPPMTYLTRYRIHQAKELLAAGS